MNAKNAKVIICLVIFFVFAHQVWAEEWIYYSVSVTSDMYYDKSSIKKVDENIIRLSTKQRISEYGGKESFSFLENIDKAPVNPNSISYILALLEIDCEKDKNKELSLVYYDKENKVLYSSTKAKGDQWNDIMPDSLDEKLKIIVCEEPATLQKLVAASPAVKDKERVHVNHKQNESKAAKEVVQNLVTKWLNSWQSGDMETYRSCYSTDFQSKGMNLDEWVSHKTNVYQKSKNINVHIDKLQISVDENSGTAVFMQLYSSSALKDAGKKKLALKKVNAEWKIYREVMIFPIVP